MPKRSEQSPESGDAASCRFVQRCPMFPLFRDHALLRSFQSRYCEAAFEECERFKWASAGEMPHPKLLPDGSWLSDEH